MKKSLWRGSKDLAESPESPDWDFQSDKTVCVRTFYGPYDLCLARKPVNGQIMHDFGDDSGLLVSNVKIKRQRGGKGEMRVTLEEAIAATEEASTVQPPKYEVENVSVDRKIESHDRYAELDADDHALIQQALDAQTKEARGIILTDDDFSNLMFELYEKKRKGIDSYTIYVPVLRRTRIYSSAHKPDPCGLRLTKLQLPSDIEAIAPDGYVWMKTADRGNHSGRFGKHERCEEWSGFDSIDEDLYAAT